ncbi:MAG: PAS domain S-box-containing protein [Kiritimatiellia bacterium]|jgi:PAS domain S-box-containing protein
MEDNGSNADGEIWFKFLMDLTPDATVIVDSDACISVVNDKAIELFGYARDELLGYPIEMLVPEATRGVHVGLRNGFLENASVRHMRESIELSAQTKNGELVPVSIGLSPLTTMGRGKYILASIRDNSVLNNALQEQAEALKQAELFNKMAVGRELKMIELKKEVNGLLKQAGSEPKYEI